MEFAQFLWVIPTLKKHCRDDLVLLRKLMQKAQEIKTYEYDKKMALIYEDKRDEALLSLVSNTKCCRQCLANKRDYFWVREYQLKFLIHEDEFYECAQVSYPHLHFSESVRSSVKSLTVPFARIQKLIGEHLECLNREYALFLNTKPGYVTLAREFENSTRIECSTMARREG